MTQTNQQILIEQIRARTEFYTSSPPCRQSVWDCATLLSINEKLRKELEYCKKAAKNLKGQSLLDDEMLTTILVSADEALSYIPEGI